MANVILAFPATVAIIALMTVLTLPAKMHTATARGGDSWPFDALIDMLALFLDDPLHERLAIVGMAEHGYI